MLAWTTTDAPSIPILPKRCSFVRNPDENGNVDWMEAIPPDHKTHKRWREVIGTLVAERVFNLNTGRSHILNPLAPSLIQILEHTKYWTDGFPEGYTLFRHWKTSPGKEPRTDLYLYGKRLSVFTITIIKLTKLFI